MAATTYIARTFILECPNSSETTTTHSTAHFRSPVASFCPNSCVFTGSAFIVGKSSSKSFKRMARNKNFRAKHSGLSFFHIVELSKQLELSEEDAIVFTLRSSWIFFTSRIIDKAIIFFEARGIAKIDCRTFFLKIEKVN